MNLHKDIVPIVMAANDKYVPYLGVSIQSLINHASIEVDYTIYVLHRDISENHKKKLEQLKKENIRIKFIDVGEFFVERNIPTIGHLSEETAYRLIADKIFPQYHKILYIDCDTIIRKDVKELYNIELDDCILGASRGRLVKGLYDYILMELECLPENYINAGVLVINLDEFKRERIGEKGLEMLSKGEFLCQDQDVLNILCEGRIKYIDGRWNVEWQHLTGLGGEVIIDESRKGTLEFIDDPFIVHYTSRIKPWRCPDIKLAEYFWEEARKSPFYEEILDQNLDGKKISLEYYFPKDRIKLNSKCILYGYGRVGKGFYKEILETHCCVLVAVCDKRADQIKGLSVPTIPPEEISKYKMDYVFIAVERRKLAEEIKQEVIALGVKEDQIIWENPVSTRYGK